MGCPLVGQVPLVVRDVDYGQPKSLVRDALCKAQAGAHNLLNRKVAAGMSVGLTCGNVNVSGSYLLDLVCVAC